MSNSINRLFHYPRKISLIYSLNCRYQYFPSTSSPLSNSNSITHSGPTFTTSVFQPSRGFANRCKLSQAYYENDTDAEVEDGGTFRAVDFVNAVKSVTLSQMEAALKALQCDLAKTSTGKACLGMADHICVETNGVKIPMSEMAAVSFYDRRLNPHILSITPHDPNAIQELKKAIDASPIDMSPRVERERLLVFMRSWKK